MDNTLAKDEVYQNVSLEFKGSALGFFKVWFVNLCLSIITLGIYSPWAKVRNNHYLYGNTYMGPHPFEYTANPMRILVGRVIVVGLFLGYYLFTVLGFVGTGLIILALFYALFPFFLRQALAFRMRYTRFHGLAFSFRASTWQFYKFFIWHTFLNIITLSIIFPYTHSCYKKLVIDHTYYGGSEFCFDQKVAGFFMIYYVKMALLSFVLIGLPIGVATGLMVPMIADGDPNEAIKALVGTLVVGFYLYVLLVSFTFKGAMDAWVGTLVYNNSSLKMHNIICEWGAWKLGWIYFTNFLVIVCTAGLLYPWAKVRLLTYKLENIGFEQINLSRFEGEAQRDLSAVGEETADFFDFDIGF